ncbi:MAG: hypothetical protein IKL55_01345 [Clostridia bacterium]|nr:hypothetical protein [Clostridia bacterium]
MRSEKGITLVALIGIFVLIVILAGISISIAAKGNNEVQNPENSVVTDSNNDGYEDEELVVNPTTGDTTNNEVKNSLFEKFKTNTVANEVK